MMSAVEFEKAIKELTSNGWTVSSTDCSYNPAGFITMMTAILLRENGKPIHAPIHIDTSQLMSASGEIMPRPKEFPPDRYSNEGLESFWKIFCFKHWKFGKSAKNPLYDGRMMCESCYGEYVEKIKDEPCRLTHALKIDE